MVFGGWQGPVQYGASESVEMRCNDVASCNYDITITGHFVKEN